MKKPIDNKTLLELFRNSAKESPSKELDQKIISYAESKTKQAKRHNWWPYLGLAASLCFIALLSPWEWQQAGIDPLSDSPEVMQQQLDLPQAEFQMKKSRIAAPQVDQFAPLQQTEQQAVPVAESVIPQAIVPDAKELKESQWDKVYHLLEKGEKEQAKALLDKMLSEQPQLESELPERLKPLQAD